MGAALDSLDTLVARCSASSRVRSSVHLEAMLLPPPAACSPRGPEPRQPGSPELAAPRWQRWQEAGRGPRGSPPHTQPAPKWRAGQPTAPTSSRTHRAPHSPPGALRASPAGSCVGHRRAVELSLLRCRPPRARLHLLLRRPRSLQGLGGRGARRGGRRRAEPTPSPSALPGLQAAAGAQRRARAAAETRAARARSDASVRPSLHPDCPPRAPWPRPVPSKTRTRAQGIAAGGPLVADALRPGEKGARVFGVAAAPGAVWCGWDPFHVFGSYFLFLWTVSRPISLFPLLVCPLLI